MIILSQNISSCSQQKIDKLFTKKADVYVVPEIARDITLPEDFTMEWNSKYPTKGLGVIWEKNRGYIPDCYDKTLTYAIPLQYDDIFILAFWPTKIDKTESYTQIAKRIINHYSDELKKHDSIITGDFNLYCKKEKPNKDADILEINDLLVSCGLKSIYHELRGESFGDETKKTYYHQFKKENSFFLDYTYSNFPIRNYELISWDPKFSDHVGQIIKF